MIVAFLFKENTKISFAAIAETIYAGLLNDLWGGAHSVADDFAGDYPGNI
ncbi:hypothetical protein GKQ23_07345 [Erwinia sp. E602]|nr:hypothetical protein [Erwinia sp. E602]QUG74823.1 hypothetical protein GKQ23_07345 [Erwinia sp. E602]